MLSPDCWLRLATSASSCFSSSVPYSSGSPGSPFFYIGFLPPVPESGCLVYNRAAGPLYCSPDTGTAPSPSGSVCRSHPDFPHSPHRSGYTQASLPDGLLLKVLGSPSGLSYPRSSLGFPGKYDTGLTGKSLPGHSPHGSSSLRLHSESSAQSLPVHISFGCTLPVSHEIPYFLPSLQASSFPPACFASVFLSPHPSPRTS